MTTMGGTTDHVKLKRAVQTFLSEQNKTDVERSRGGTTILIQQINQTKRIVEDFQIDIFCTVLGRVLVSFFVVSKKTFYF